MQDLVKDNVNSNIDSIISSRIFVINPIERDETELSIRRTRMIPCPIAIGLDKAVHFSAEADTGVAQFDNPSIPKKIKYSADPFKNTQKDYPTQFLPALSSPNIGSTDRLLEYRMNSPLAKRSAQPDQVGSTIEPTLVTTTFAADGIPAPLGPMYPSSPNSVSPPAAPPPRPVGAVGSPGWVRQSWIARQSTSPSLLSSTHRSAAVPRNNSGLLAAQEQSNGHSGGLTSPLSSDTTRDSATPCPPAMQQSRIVQRESSPVSRRLNTKPRLAWSSDQVRLLPLLPYCPIRCRSRRRAIERGPER